MQNSELKKMYTNKPSQTMFIIYNFFQLLSIMKNILEKEYYTNKYNRLIFKNMYLQIKYL